MSEILDRCLTDLAGRIDEDQEQAGRNAWVDFLDDRCDQDIFIPPTRRPSPSKVNWPSVKVNQAFEDEEAMLFQQFGGCSSILHGGEARRLNVRCNFGTNILPSLFGCEVFKLDDELNVLPGGLPLASKDKVSALLDCGVPDLRSGLGGKVFAMAERFLQIFEELPVLGRNVVLYHPDMQGPMDTVEVVWGSDMFYGFYDSPDLLRDVLALVTETYACFMQKWYSLVGGPEEYSTHWGMMHKGALMLRNDSLMNLSPETYVDFVRPHDQRLFSQFGGQGAMHFCGRGDHYMEAMSQMEGLTAVHMSQPHLNDMEAIYRSTIDKNIKLIGLDIATAGTTNRRAVRGQIQAFHAPLSSDPQLFHLGTGR